MWNMKTIINNSYVYKTEKLGLNKEKLKEYMDQFKGLEDLLGVTIKTKKSFITTKKQLLSA